MIESFLHGRFSNDKQANYDALKYSALTFVVAFIHTFFAIVFLAMQIIPLFIYNCIVLSMYFYLSKKLPELNNYTRLFFVYISEILIHSSFATITVGWNYAFMFYIIALIPVSFYMTFSVSSFKNRLFFPIFTTGLVVSVFIATRIITLLYGPIRGGFPPYFMILLSSVNYLTGFACTFIFSILFAVDVHSMQLMMESNQERLADQASFDPLTHFLNRRAMDEKLTNAHRNAIINDKPYSLIMCDIDHFKIFNDTYGHDCGDYVLQNISKIISAQIRNNDSASRWGGEEFLILISDNLDTSKEVAERIRKAIETYEFYYNGQTLHVTITLGVSTYFASSKTKTLIEIADKRLYKGKENGRNQVVYN